MGKQVAAESTAEVGTCAPVERGGSREADGVLAGQLPVLHHSEFIDTCHICSPGKRKAQVSANQRSPALSELLFLPQTEAGDSASRPMTICSHSGGTWGHF